MAQYDVLLNAIIEVPELRDLVNTAAYAEINKLREENSELYADIEERSRSYGSKLRDECFACTIKKHVSLPSTLRSSEFPLYRKKLMNIAELTNYKVSVNIEMERNDDEPWGNEKDSIFIFPRGVDCIESIHILGYAYSLNFEPHMSGIRVTPPQALSPVFISGIYECHIRVHDARIDYVSATVSVFSWELSDASKSLRKNLTQLIDPISYEGGIPFRKRPSELRHDVDKLARERT
jgi:hypothetical protein